MVCESACDDVSEYVGPWFRVCGTLVQSVRDHVLNSHERQGERARRESKNKSERMLELGKIIIPVVFALETKAI